MGLDTKYRPLKYEDVLGQESTIKILRQFIKEGKGWDQSYLFVGGWGSGKTTLGRIMARAMLCEAPVEGMPCDKCSSCVSILDGTSIDFIEVDAATNSGVPAMRKLTEDLQFSTFSGRRRLYLFDEAHQLTKDALDAMLLPLENGTLVCIFCTTEPEKMRETILSRCAPAFVIHPVTPDQIAARLTYVCEKEGIQVVDPSLLVTIAEMKESHIRDCLKAVEGLSMLGPISRESVVSYLHLDQSNSYLDILEALGKDLGAAIQAANAALKNNSPVTIYEKLANTAMMAYQVGMGFTKAPVYLDGTRLMALGKHQGQALLGFAARFASRPGYPNAAMLLCDLGALHHGGGSLAPDAVILMSSAPAQTSSAASPVPASVAPTAPTSVPAPPQPVVKMEAKPPIAGKMSVVPLAGSVNDGRPRDGSGTQAQQVQDEIPVALFAQILGLQLRDERRKLGGSP